MQGELEHRQSKWQYPCSGKQQNRMVSSIANQEAVEQFIKKVIDARQLLEAQHPRQACHPRHTQTSPWDHYHIAKEAQKTHNLFVWLTDTRMIPQLRCHIIVFFFKALIFFSIELCSTTQRPPPCPPLQLAIQWRRTQIH